MTQIIMKRPKSRSYDQAKLKYISDILCDNIEDLLIALGIESSKNMGKLITMSCPIHGGDNESALNIYHQGDHYRGNWKCRTHQCEEVFKASIIGFIRGCLSHSLHGWAKSGDIVCSFQEALEFATSFIKQDWDSIKISKRHKEKIAFVNTIKYVAGTNVNNTGPKISRDTIRKNLSIPSEYFIGRGFNEITLKNYDVGECLIQGKEMYERAVVPIYDENFQYMVGCTGRSVHEKCSNCKGYHKPTDSCPTPEEVWKYSKWRHNAGFKTQDYLYNYWIAKHRIKETTSVIIVESPGNVWRLAECGITNAVAIFGSSMSDRQKMLLDISGAMTIVTIMDNDDAGKKAAEQIKNKCDKIYNIVNITITHDDIASMSIEEIKNLIIPSIKEYI
jgi:5S rRNA maturation endonuclease (ribonuclease M5)